MRISKVEKIVVQLPDASRIIERAIDQARRLALITFGIDENCHSDEVADWERSSCSIRIEFEKTTTCVGYLGASHIVEFKAWCEKSDEEE